MELKSFSHYNSVINLRGKGLIDILDGKLFNYYKILQHALVYSEAGANKLIKNYFHKPYFVVRIYYFLKSIADFKKKTFSLNQEKYIIIDNGRYKKSSDGKINSLYFSKLMNVFNEKQLGIYYNRKPEFEVNAENVIPNLKLRYSYYTIDTNCASILNELIAVYRAISSSSSLSKRELAYLQSCFFVFFEDFLFYYNWLKEFQSVEFVFFTTHYHSEGLLAACKILNVKSIELQHGLISKNDIYYSYPDFIRNYRNKCMFADLICVYGEYWANILREGNEYRNEFCVLGDYTENAIIDEANVNCKENIIFIGAQKLMHEEYVKLAVEIGRIISECHKDWRIKIKLHPSETKKNYYFDKLAGLTNIEIIGNESDLLSILKKSKIQISLYSTTFFDALGLDVMNLSVQEFSDYADYARLMVEDGIAFPMKFGEDPVKIFEEKYDKMEKIGREYYYSLFNPSKLTDKLKIV